VGVAVTWDPLVDDDGHLELARAIAAATALQPKQSIDERIDHAILRAYLGCDDGDDEDLGAAELAAAAEALGATAMSPGLYGGATRIGWAITHLAAGPDADAVGDAVDRSIRTLLAGDDHAVYDLVSGLVGFGVFALERGPAGAALAARVLDHLERLARPRPVGRAWFTPPGLLPGWQREVAPAGYWNLGLAHGAPGVIALLARYLAAGVEPARARPLLDDAVAHLLAAGPPHSEGRFVGWISDRADDAPRAVRRVAWCYGDLGVAVALAAAAATTGDQAWREAALDVARGAARCPGAQAGVGDAGGCHGAAGAAHLFNRLHQHTGDAELATAARAWLARAIAMPRPDDRTLLTGAPGVALVLAAACSEVEPSWDRLLLADLEPAP
jgi:lantibiotic biosynthesis protein